MFSWLKPKVKEVIVEKIVEVPREVIHVVRRVGSLRRGMWVTHEGQVGILTSTKGDKVEVHFVNGKGETYNVKDVPIDEVVQARKSQVPDCRKGNIDQFDYPE